MLLSVDMDGKWCYPRSPEEVGRLVTALVESPFKDAWFCFAEEEVTEDNLVPGAFLHASVNGGTGAGALIWGLTDGFAGSGPAGVWVTDNPRPSAVDPKVVADPGGGQFHDPRNALPIAHIRAALEEFCRTGTGDRPTGVPWIEGRLDGQRLR